VEGEAQGQGQRWALAAAGQAAELRRERRKERAGQGAQQPLQQEKGPEPEPEPEQRRLVQVRGLKRELPPAQELVQVLAPAPGRVPETGVDLAIGAETGEGAGGALIAKSSVVACAAPKREAESCARPALRRAMTRRNSKRTRRPQRQRLQKKGDPPGRERRRRVTEQPKRPVGGRVDSEREIRAGTVG
jgi:hypothetical protein